MLVHCTTQPGAERVSMLASACVLHLTTSYFVQYFRCVLGVLRISGSVWKLPGSSEVNLELSIVQREVSIEVKNKGWSSGSNRIISGSPEQRFEVQGVKMRSSRPMKENQSQYSNMSISYKIRSLIYRVSIHSTNKGCRSAIVQGWG